MAMGSWPGAKKKRPFFCATAMDGWIFVSGQKNSMRSPDFFFASPSGLLLTSHALRWAGVFFCNEKNRKRQKNTSKPGKHHAKLAMDAQFCAHNVHVRDMPAIYTRAPFLSKSNMYPARKNKAILFMMLIDLGWDAVLRAAACI